MKKIYFLFTLLFTITLSFSQNEFITTWEVTSSDLSIKIDTNSFYYTYNYTVDFGDGVINTNVTGDITHTYSSAGIYTVKISGIFPSLYQSSNNSTNSEKLKSVEQWGNIQWLSMKRMFYYCLNMVINATDVPDLSQVTDMTRMFSFCDSFNQNINNWDVSNVNIMRDVFYSCDIFNQPLDNWNVSNVTDMSGMFYQCSLFNQNINNWDVSSVVDMSDTFHYCNNFNQPLNNWDVFSVTNMNQMFKNCNSFNQTLDNWDVSSVTEMFYIFGNCDSFNQSINNWDVSSVTNLSQAFVNCDSFDQPLNNWDVSNVNDMSFMFSGCTSFNQSLNNWDVSNVSNMFKMFNNSTAFNQSLDSWNFSSVTNFSNFLDNSGLNVSNYDSFLQRLADLNINNQSIGVLGLGYCNDSPRNYLLNNGCVFVGDSQSSDCNQIQGTIYYDYDNNGCTNTDIHTSNLIVDSNNGINSYSTFVTSNSYDISVYGGNQTVSIINLPSYFTATPQSQTVDFSTTSTEQVDFCITANQVVEDLNITILPLDDARPGFESNYKLIIQNVGTETLNAVTANVVFDNNKQSFVSANPTATSTTANTLDFSIGTIQPFGSAEVEFVMQTLTPPTVNADDVLTFTANVLPDASDYTPNDNVFTLDQIVVNAYDPNDKRVLQGDEITMSQTTDYLDYIIRFQNTGSANATFVRIEDVLDPELDWNTIKITSASHAYEVKITNGNEVEFLFDNINLAYEAADEPNSHGYIAYKIKPKTTVQLGDVFSGDASIYFDYNLPIITNTVSTTIVNNLSTDEFSVSQLISIYPNPVKEGLFLNTKNGVSITSAKIYDLKGNKLIDINNSVEYINTEALSSGIYLLSVQTNQGKISKKIIKN